MTQDEKWLLRYKEVKIFIEVNHRNPSKYVPEERLMVHFMKKREKTDERRGIEGTEIRVVHRTVGTWGDV